METHHPRGVTLIEMLIALVVFSIVMALAVSMLRFFTERLQKAEIVYPERAMQFTRLRSTLESVAFYTVRQENPLTLAEEFHFFFKGEPEEVRYITTSPLEARGIAAGRLYQEGNTVYLAETPLYSNETDYQSPEQAPGPRLRIPVFEKVRKFTITYYKAREAYTHYQYADYRDAVPDAMRVTITHTDGVTNDYFFKVGSNFEGKRDATKSSRFQQ